jgi:hypothetical protein
MSAGKIIYWLLWIPMLFVIVFTYGVGYFSLALYHMRVVARSIHDEIKDL